METINELAEQLESVMRRMDPHFAGDESRVRLRQYVTGLLSEAERKNGWQLAEAVGEETPYALQQFLARARWDEDAVQDELRHYIEEHLGEEDGVLVVDETGFLKKGTHSAGVARQYSGTAGRVENSQVGVFLTYSGSRGSAILDRALYLPRAWTQDRARLEAAGVPETVGFQTKPQLALAMLQHAHAQGVRARWVTADTVYGMDHALRAWLEEAGHGYILGVTGQESVWLSARQPRSVAGEIARAQEAPDAWQSVSAGDGTKGPRLFDWVRVRLAEPAVDGWEAWLLLRRSLADAHDVAAFLCLAPAGTSLSELVAVEGRRWTIEQVFEEAKGEVGLDHYEVRSYSGWKRHMTLCALAHAYLAVSRVAANEVAAALKKGGLLPGKRGSLRVFKARRGLSSR